MDFDDIADGVDSAGVMYDTAVLLFTVMLLYAASRGVCSLSAARSCSSAQAHKSPKICFKLWRCAVSAAYFVLSDREPLAMHNGVVASQCCLTVR